MIFSTITSIENNIINLGVADLADERGLGGHMRRRANAQIVVFDTGDKACDGAYKGRSKTTTTAPWKPTGNALDFAASLRAPLSHERLVQDKYETE